MRDPSGPVSSAAAASPPSAHDRLVARARDHVFEEAALHGIVVDDENALRHDGNSTQTDATKALCRVGAMLAEEI